MTTLPSVDLAVVGGGIVGCACAWAARQAGLDVSLFEARRLGAGTTAAGMGHMVVIDDDPAELALARFSIASWREWPAWDTLKRARTGTLWLAETEAQAVIARSRIERLRAAQWPAEWLDADALRTAEPRLSHDLVGAMWVPQDELVDPPEIVRILAGQLRDAGGRIHEGCPVAGLQADGLVLADGRRIAARHVLLAAGFESIALWPGAAHLGLRPRHGQLAITDRYPGWIRHALIELGYMDSAHGDAAESVAFNAQPRPTGQVLFGSSRREGVATSAVDLGLMARMLARACRFLPATRDLTVIRTWAGCRPATADGRPLIGPLPGREGEPTAHWVATGHEGLGVTTAMGTARLWLDLLLGRPPAIDPRPYAPSRATARGSAQPLVQESV